GKEPPRRQGAEKGWSGSPITSFSLAFRAPAPTPIAVARACPFPRARARPRTRAHPHGRPRAPSHAHVPGLIWAETAQRPAAKAFHERRQGLIRRRARLIDASKRVLRVL